MRDTMGIRFAEMDARFDRVERDLSLVKDALREHSRQHAETRRAIDEIHTKLDQKVDRAELRSR